MTTDFKPNSPTIVLAFSSLLFLAVGGPIMWVAANATHSTSVRAWAYPMMYAGSGVFALGYLLFVLTLLSAFAAIIVRTIRASRVGAVSSPE